MQTSSPRLGPNAAGSRGARDNAHVVTLIQEALCSGDARCVVEAVEKACRLKGLPVPHELYGEMTLVGLGATPALARDERLLADILYGVSDALVRDYIRDRYEDGRWDGHYWYYGGHRYTPHEYGRYWAEEYHRQPPKKPKKRKKPHPHPRDWDDDDDDDDDRRRPHHRPPPPPPPHWG